MYTVQSGKCLIGGKCYNASEFNQADDTQKCDPEKSSTEWTPSKSDSLIETNLLFRVEACGCILTYFSYLYLHHPHKGYCNLPEDVSRLKYNITIVQCGSKSRTSIDHHNYATTQCTL